MSRRGTVIGSVALALVAGGVAFVSTHRGPSDDVDRVAIDASPRDRAPGAARSSGDPPRVAVDPRVANEPSDPIAAWLHEPTVIHGTIEAADAMAPERIGASCELGVSVADEPDRCRVVLICGSTQIHASPAPRAIGCTRAADRSLATLSDERTMRADGNPSLDYTRDRGTLIVRDDSSGSYGDFELVVRITDPELALPDAR